MLLDLPRDAILALEGTILACLIAPDLRTALTVCVGSNINRYLDH